MSYQSINFFLSSTDINFFVSVGFVIACGQLIEPQSNGQLASSVLWRFLWAGSALARKRGQCTKWRACQPKIHHKSLDLFGSLSLIFIGSLDNQQRGLQWDTKGQCWRRLRCTHALLAIRVKAWTQDRLRKAAHWNLEAGTPIRESPKKEGVSNCSANTSAYENENDNSEAIHLLLIKTAMPPPFFVGRVYEKKVVTRQGELWKNVRIECCFH